MIIHSRKDNSISVNCKNIQTNLNYIFLNQISYNKHYTLFNIIEEN